MTEAEGLLLHVQEAGTGEPLVILHGLLGSGRNWRSIARELAQRYRVLTVDLRNHGESPHSESMSYPLMAADLACTLQHAGLRTASILGHSMGGKVAMLYALTRPEATARLIVEDIAPVAYPLRYQDLVEALLDLDLAALDGRAAAEAALAARIPDLALRRFLLQNLEHRDGRYAWRCNLPAMRAALPALMDFPLENPDARYEGLASFIAGGRSDLVLPEHEPVIRQLFPRAGIQRLPELGHWLHAEEPARFIEEVHRIMSAS